MKNKLAESLFSLLALYLLSCIIAAAMVLGMLLLPFVFVALLLMPVAELISGKMKTVKPEQTPAIKLRGKVISITSWIPRNRKAA